MMDQSTNCDMFHGDKTTIALLNTSTLTAKRFPDFPITAGPSFWSLLVLLYDLVFMLEALVQGFPHV